MRVLVLSGGGDKGSYQVGALRKWLAEDSIEYDVFCGISVGSINSAFLAQFPAGDPKGAWTHLESIWNRVTTNNVKKSWCPLGVLESIWKTSIYNSAPLQKWILSELDQSKIASSGKKLRVVSVSWNTAQSHVADEKDPQIASRVLASASFPVMLNPIEIDGEQWSDGGLRSVTPLGEAIRMGADDIDVIMCNNPDLFGPFNPKSAAIPGHLMRALDILSTQIEVADLKICGYKNDLAELKPEYKKVKIRLLQPSVILTDDSLSFNPKDIQRMMAIGYEDVCELGSG